MVTIIASGWIAQRVFKINTIRIIPIEIPREDCLISVYIALIGVWLTKAGVAAFESYAVFELECGCSVARAIRVS
ncbi:hypothetical protein ES703_88795 [subsurface metagenome]